jgi:hypothetical protein
MRSFFFILIGISFFSACQPSFVCDPNLNQIRVKISLLTYRCPVATTISTLNNIPVDSVYLQQFYRIYSPNAQTLGASILFQDTTGFTTLSLPLSNQTDSVEYIFTMNRSNGIGLDTVSDILKIKYSRQLKYISQGCGYEYYYKINSYTMTNNYFDLINQIDPSVNPTVSLNFKLYNLTHLLIPSACRP